MLNEKRYGRVTRVSRANYGDYYQRMLKIIAYALTQKQGSRIEAVWDTWMVEILLVNCILRIDFTESSVSAKAKQREHASASSDEEEAYPELAGED